jgi:ferredoxin-NADP reductase/ferredoxin
MLAHSGWCQSRWARENLCLAHERIGVEWDTQKAGAGALVAKGKRDFDALQSGLRRLRQSVSLAEATSVRTDLVRLAEAIARSSGGILGTAGIRREERTALLVFSAMTDALLLASDGRTKTPVNGAAAGAATPAPAVATEHAPATARPVAGAAKARFQARCVQIVDETHDVKTFRLAIPPSVRFSFVPGQFVTLDFQAGAERLVRSYTIASSPSRRPILELTIKRVPGGRASNWLHDHLKFGDELTVKGPAGKFSYDLAPPAEKMLFISGGSGITPVMSMSRQLHDRADPRDVVFMHSARNERDLIFRDELALLAARNPRFRPIFTLTDAHATGWTGRRGRVTADLIEASVPDFRERTIFLCGPTPFMDAVRAALVAAQFPMEFFHAESFGGAPRARPAAGESGTTPAPVVGDAPPPEVNRASSTLLRCLPSPQQSRLNLPVLAGVGDGAAALDAAPPAAGSPSADTNAIVFSSSGQEAVGCASETILEAAEALGLSIPSACRAGVCGTCRTRKISGNVTMDCDAGLDLADRSAGFILACTAHPVGRVAVDV